MVHAVVSGTLLAIFFIGWSWAEYCDELSDQCSLTAYWRALGMFVVTGTFGVLMMASVGVALVAEWKARRSSPEKE